MIFLPLFKHPPFQLSLACSFLLFVLFLDWLQHSLKPLIKQLFLVCFCLDQGWADCSLQATSGPLPALVNKDLLVHRHAHSFTCYLWLLPRYEGKPECLPESPKYLLLGSLQKEFVTPLC